MTKPTDDHQTQNTPAGEFEPFETFDLEHCPNTGPNPHKPEPAQAADPMAQAFFTLSQAGKIFGKKPRTMRLWADTGRIRTIEIGRSRHVTKAEIQRLQNSGEG